MDSFTTSLAYSLRNKFWKNALRCIAFLLIIHSSVFAEGTKQAWVSPGDATTKNYFPIYAGASAANVYCSLNGTYYARDNERYKIRINTVGEYIHMGFNENTPANPRIYYRLRRPDGTIAIAGTVVPTAAGAGYIATWAEAVAGPENVAGVTVAAGYTPVSHLTTMIGDYYIEFNMTNANSNAGNPQKMGHGVFDVASDTVNTASDGLRYLDVTVSSNDKMTIYPGRFHSKEFALFTEANTAPGISAYGTASVPASLFVYTTDSVINRLDFLGMTGSSTTGSNSNVANFFKIGSNNFGCVNSGTITANRQSRNGRIFPPNVVPLYEEFFNMPDATNFPVGQLPKILSYQQPEGCGGAGYKFTVANSHGGQNEIFLDINGTSGYQAGTSDKLLAFNAVAGTNTYNWDGKDGLGNTVASGTKVTVSVRYIGGIVHFPLQDVEQNPNGFAINLIGPTSGAIQTKCFYDDTQIGSPANTENVSTGGVNGGSVVHKWTFGAGDLGASGTTAANNGTGNERTMNTWVETTYQTQSLIDLYPTANCPTYTPATAKCVAGYIAGESLAVAGDLDGGVKSAALDPTTTLPAGTALNSATGEITVSNPALLVAGTYTVKTKITDNQNGYATATVTLTFYPVATPGSVTAPTTITYCNNGDPAIINSASLAGGGNGTYNYQWESSTDGVTYSSIASANATSYDPGNLTTTTYFRRMVMSASCPVYSNVVKITINPLPVVNAGSPVTINNTQSTTIGGSPTASGGSGSGYSYVWTPSSTLDLTNPANPIATPTTVGANVYNVVVTDGNGCSNSASVTVTVNPTSNLTMAKVASAGPYSNGQTVTYTLTVSNAGPNNATGVNVTDLLPSGLTYVSSTPSAGTYTSSSGLWAVGALANGSNATLTITATINSTGTITNTAVASANEFDNSLAGNTANCPITVGSTSNLGITKTATAGPYYNGQNVTYTITVSNAGPDIANSVVVNDMLPAGLTYVSSTPSSGTYTQGTGVWNAGNIANGGSATLNIVATINTTGSIINTANTSSSSFDNNTANNTVSCPINATGTSNLSITKTAGAGPFSNGQNVTYTITVGNTGPNDATGVIVTDALPAGLTYVSSSASVSSYNSGTGKWNIGNLTNGATATLTITATVTTSGTINNTASVLGTEFDPNTVNNSSTSSISGGNATNLSITKTASSAPYNNGQNITYTITVSNLGPDAASGVTATDVLPSGLTYVSSTPSTGTYTQGTGAWAIGNLSNGSSATLTIVATMNTTGSLSNTATVTGNDYDATPGNNSANSTVTVGATANLSVTKTASAAPYYNGQNITYTITVNNAGPNAASGASVTDLLPSGLTYVSSTPSTGTYTSGTGVWSIGSLANGGTATLTIVATPNTTGNITNTATVTASEFDNNVTNNSSSVTSNVAATAAVSVVKTASAGPYYNGQNITYTITASNAGPNTASGVSVNDLLPAGLTFVSSTASSGSYVSTSGVWTIGTLTNGANATLTIIAKPNTTGNITNTATISNPEHDNSPVDNTSPVTINSQATSNLSVSKVASAGPYVNGQNVTYTITIGNTGPDNATGVAVNDLLPATLIYQSSTPSTGTYTSGSGVWSVGNLANGGTATLTIIAKINGTGTVSNTATISGTQYDDTPANNTSTSSIGVGTTANLGVTKTVSAAPYNRGANVTYTITATNAGPNDASGVNVTDILPAGLVYVSSTPSTGTYNQGTGIWAIGPLVNGGTQTLTVVATLNATGSITNTATIAGADSDNNNANNSSSSTISVNPTSNLSITKVPSAAPYYNGQNITYTITVSNAGPDNATGVSVTDILPASLAYVISSATVSSYNSGSGVWNVGTLASGATATLTLVAKAKVVGSISNTATISGNEFDSNTGDNSSTSTVTAAGASDLSVTKVASAAPYYNQENITYTITVSNAGPNNATGVNVSDLLPSSLTYFSSSPSVGTYNVGTGVWSVGSLANGASQTLTLTATVNNAGSVSNTASVTANEFDSSPGNNSSTSTVTAGGTSDITATKTVSAGPYSNGQNVTYTIAVNNAGPDNATGVVVTDLLPAGLVYQSSTPSTGTYNSGTGIWTVGNLANASSATIQIVAKVTGTGTIINKATVKSDQHDKDTTSNSPVAPISVGTTANLAITKTASAGPYYNGDNVTYTLTVSNSGPNAATSVNVIDVLPSGLTYVSSAASSGSYNSGTGAWAIATLSNGGSQTLTITAKINTTGSITNSTSVTGGDFDNDNSNNTSAVTINAGPTANLSITKTASAGPYRNGQNITYTITVSNAGPNTASNVAATDILPASLTYISSTPSVGSYDNTTGNWSIGTINNGGSATLIITALMNNSGTIANTASVNGTEHDANGTDNTATSTISATPTADLSVIKTVSAGPYTNGQNITYTIVAHNTGPNTATGVNVNDILPAGLVYVSSTTTIGSYNQGTGVWGIGNISKNNSETMTIVAKINTTGTITNSANINGTNYDNDPTNNSNSSTINVGTSADLGVVITKSPAPYYDGQNITYTITVSNAGPDDATGVNLSEVLPAGLVYISSTPSTGSYNSGTGNWNVGSLLNGGTATLTLVAKINGTGVISNSVSVSGNDYDSKLSNNSATSVINASPTANLSVTKTVTAGPYNNGQNVTYTITVTNSGPDNASGAYVTDMLPAGLTYVNSTASTGSYNNVSGVWNIGTVANGASVTLNVVATITSTGSISNTATVTATEFDDNTTGNTAVSTISTGTTADLSISKTIDAGPYYNGKTVTYTITATNNGPNNATGVKVTDVLPSSLLYVSSTPSTGTFDSNTGIWTVGALATSGTATITIVAKITTNGSISNTATIAGDDYDNNAGSNTANSSVVATLNANLSATSTVSGGPYYDGDNVTYTITVTNAGPNTATGVKLNDMLPSGIAYVSSAPTAGMYNSASGLWTIGTLNPGESVTLTVVGKLNTTGSINNSGNVAGNEFDSDLTDNSYSKAINVLPTSNVSVVKTISAGPYVNGQNVTYTITVNNAGPDNATGVSATDALPAGLTYVSSNATSGTYNQVSGLWTIGTLSNGNTATLTIVATITSSGTINNVATATANEHDNDPTGNTSSKSISPGTTADLSVTGVTSTGPYYNGDLVTYTFTVKNAGPNGATAVSLDDLLPSDLVYVSSSPSTGSYNSANGKWTIGTMNVNGVETITIVARINGTGTITNPASVSGNEYDNNTANNSTAPSMFTANASANLSVNKVASGGPYNAGQNITYTITVNNAGPDNATSVSVNDLLPSGLTYVSSTASTGSYAGPSGIWNIGSLTNGSSASLTIVAKLVGTGTISNTATIAGSEHDANTTDNTSTSVINSGTTADLQVTTSLSPAPYNNGQSITYTFTVSNLGPDGASGVKVNELLPAGLSLTSSSFTTGSYDPATGIWIIGSLANGSTQTLTLVAYIDSAATITNTASVSGNDYDPSTSNNSSATTISTNPSANLSVTKTVSAGPYINGNTVTYTIVINNAGPNNATGVNVNDLLPSGLVYVSSTTTVGSYNSATGLWAVGNLANGASATLTIMANLNGAGNISNSATISGNEFDEAPVTNTSTSTINVGTSVDLSTTVNIAPAGPYVYNQLVTYTITANNAGPNTASGVKLTDKLSASLAYVSSTQTKGSYDPASGVWNISSLTSGSSAVLTITGRINATGVIYNNASITGSDFDIDLANNTDKDSITVGSAADITLTKTANGTTFNVSDTVTYTIKVANAGPDNATNVDVVDLLPAGLNFVSFTSSNSTAYNNVTGHWAVGTVAKSQNETLTIKAIVDTTGSIVNTASVTASTFDYNNTGDTPSATISGNASSDISVVNSISAGPYYTGGVVTYTVDVHNAGPSKATNVNLVDLLPASLTYISSTAPAGTSYNSANGKWNVGTLSTGSTQTLTIQATLASAGTITTTASAQGNEFDPILANNTDTSMIVVAAAADLGLTGSANTTSPNVGEDVTFTFKAINNGSNNATGVNVNALVPAGLTYKSSNPISGTYNPGTGVWTIGNLNNGSQTALIVIATSASPGAVIYTADIKGNEHDGNIANDTAKVQLNGNATSDLQLTISPDALNYNNGGQGIFTYTLVNKGPSPATGTKVNVTIPSTFVVSGSTPSGSTTYTTGLWTVGTLPVNGQETLILTGKFNAVGSVTVSGTASSDNVDILPLDNTAQQMVTVKPTADIAVTGSSSKAMVNTGEELTYTIIVDNIKGPDAASSVNVNVPLPSGVVYISSTAGKGVYDYTTGKWTVGALAVSESAQLTIKVTVTGLDDIYTNVTATAFEFDNDLSNNSTSILVKGQNKAPIANNDTVYIEKDQVATIKPLGNDYDLDGTIDSSSVQLFTENTVGQVTSFNILNSAFTYYPKSGFVGTDKFYYIVNDKQGASSKPDTVTVIVKDVFSIPNGFSPNGDGKNDKWVIRGLDSYPDNEVVVINRWGAEVYRKNGYSSENAWDGSDLHDGTYFYVVKYIVNGEKKSYTGYITIFKD